MGNLLIFPFLSGAYSSAKDKLSVFYAPTYKQYL